MSIGRETPNSSHYGGDGNARQPIGHFDSETGIYQTRRSNVVSFPTVKTKDVQNSEHEADKWPALLAITFAISSSAILWMGIVLSFKAIF